MLNDPYASIIKLPANSNGKDYVIGDLHGCLELLHRLLERVQFDPECDRLFSVGDLIDRGRDSLGCLQLLKQPWFYAVQGNHERMMLDFFVNFVVNRQETNPADFEMSDFLWNGGLWVMAYYQEDQQRMSDEIYDALLMVAALPLVLIVGEGDQRFHVIHAELSKPPFKRADPVWLDADLDEWLAQDDIPVYVEEGLLWERTLMNEHALRVNQAWHPGLSTTYCGHTFDILPRQVLSHVCLDTGAFLSSDVNNNWRQGEYSLTLFDIADRRWYSASYQCDEITSEQLPDVTH